MTKTVIFLWVAFATLMGFAAGGSLVSGWLTPQPAINRSCGESDKANPNCQSPEERHQATEVALGEYTKWLMIFTGVLAAATIGLGVATIGLYLTGEREFISSHRPRVIAREVYVDGDTIWLRLANVGDTAATIVESYLLVHAVFNKSELRPLLSTGKNDIGGIVLAAGEMKEIPFNPAGDLEISTRPRRESLPFITERHFTGTIVYVDDLGIKRRSVFRRRWMAGDQRFVRLPPDEERDNEYAD